MTDKSIEFSHRDIRTRLRMVLAIFIAIFIVVFYRLFIVQVVDGRAYRAKATELYTSPQSQIVADRGNIYFFDKAGTQITAAGQNIIYKVVVHPRRITSVDFAWKRIVGLVPTINEEDFRMSVAKTRRLSVPLPGSVSELDANAIREAQIPGIQIIEEHVRGYPGGSRAAHVLGFIGYEGDDLLGQYGLEKEYEDILRGPRESLYKNFFVDMFSDVRSFMDEREIKAGNGNLITTIEPTVQMRAEELLDELSSRWTPQEAGIIIMDPKTGGIIAMSARPTFDPNDFKSVKEVKSFTNPTIQHVYEMGSILKPLILAFAFQEGVIEPESTYFDAGSIRVGDRTIYNFDKKGRGKTTFEQVLIQSLNTGMVTAMGKLDRNEVYDYLHDLELGKKTGIDLPYEAKGLVSNLERRRAVEYANISFGQGIAMTPMATMRALSALANNGIMVAPHIVQKVEYQIGTDEGTFDWALPKRVLDPKSVEIIARIMTKLVDKNFGEGKPPIPNYSIAAKTGTAQIAKPTGGYYDDRNLHSFFGFFPSYSPKYSIFIYMVHPLGARYSAETLSKPFLDMTQFLINYYGIPPDRTTKTITPSTVSPTQIPSNQSIR